MDRGDHAGALRWHFSDCVLDESSLQLQVRGRVAELERKPLEVLRYLLRHAGEVVTKDEVLDAVWPGRILSDTVLAKAVSRLREVLGENASETVKTVHGYGYRLVAEVRVEPLDSAPPQAANLGLRVGSHPPLRPNWVLTSHLQSGGRGEVWRGRQPDSGEERVFKFALDAAAFTSLKREITLNRLLRSTLGEQAAIVPVLDWNLQESPFFIELAYLPLGSLADWASARGGLATVAAAQRLELAAQIAEAVSAAHGAGVLHKDLKPGNVLLTGDPERPRVLLTDFGSGAVMEQSQLDALGITRLGLTQAAVDSDSGTPLYFAPELLAGQPHTVRSDNYALGVLLYQLAVGDFKKPLSPGWERDIADPLLREDIALAADGNPLHRLGDAEELARRLRTLDSRRAQQAQRAAQQALEQSQREAAEKLRADNQQLRTRRRWQWAAIVALGIGLLASLSLYRRAGLAQQQALEAANTAEAVSAFLADDLLAAADPARVDVRRLTVKTLIDAAEQRVGPRFAAKPLAEARVRRALATSYYSLGQTDSAFGQIRQGWRLLPGLLDHRSAQLPDIAAQLAQLPDAARNEDLPLWTQVLAAVQAQAGAGDPRALEVALFIGGIHFDRGNFDDCFRILNQSLATARTLTPRPARLEARIQHLLSRAYISVDRYPDSVAASREALSLLRSPALADSSDRAIALQLHYLGRALRFYGQLPQAEQALQEAGSTIFRNARDDSEPVTELRWELLELHLMQKRWSLAESEADSLLANIQGQFESSGDNRTLLFLLGARAALAGGQGDWAKAESLAREQLAGFEARQRDPLRSIPRDRISIVVSTVGLMRALIEQGKTKEARAALDRLDPADLRTVDVVPLNSVSLHRVLGLLALAEGQAGLARQELGMARNTLSKLCAPEHPWFAELDAALERAGADESLRD